MSSEPIDFAALNNPKATGKEWHGRGYPQYDPAIHLQMLKDIFSNGGGVSAFLAACQIARATFYQWLKDKPEFKHQYDIALSEGAAMWELMPLELAKSGINMPYAYFVLIARQRYKTSPIQLVETESESTTSAKMDVAWRSLRDGGINPQEFNQIASGLSTESRIAEVDLQKQALEHTKESSDECKGMKDEALKAYMAVMSGKKLVEANNDQ